MLVRYFAAAAAATGVDEEHVELDPGIATTLAQLAQHLAEAHAASASQHTPPLSVLLTRCSFLRNEIAARDLEVVLRPTDVVDVLPPFAGG